MSERDVKGIWIPIDIWEDPELTLFETCLLAEIDSLDQGDGCWKSDASLAKRMRCSLGHLKNRVSSLKHRKYLKTIKVQGRRRYLRTCFSRHLVRNSRKREVTSEVSEKLPVSLSTIKTKSTLSSTQNGFFPSNGEVSPFIVDCTTKLEEYIRKSRRIHPKFNRAKWFKEIWLLLKELAGDRKRLRRVLNYYVGAHHDEYTPQADSAESFRRKFAKIELWARKNLQESDHDPTIVTKERKGNTLITHFDYSSWEI